MTNFVLIIQENCNKPCEVVYKVHKKTLKNKIDNSKKRYTRKFK